MKEILKHVQYINCTTDHWRETDSNQEYITIKIHFYHPDTFILNNRVVGTFAVSDQTSVVTHKPFKA